jgi:hypothetical protein
MKKILLLSALLIGAALHAEDVTLTRAQASELYLALATAEAGFAPANTVAAADNINALRPHVEALDKGKTAYQRAVRALVRAQPAEAEAHAERLALELEAKADEAISVALVPLNLTDEELTAAKVKPASLSILRRWLKPAAKK